MRNSLKMFQTPNMAFAQKTVGAGGCMPGIQRVVKHSFPVNQQAVGKEKGRTANPTLWDGCFSSHDENQQSTVLGDARNPGLAYENFVVDRVTDSNPVQPSGASFDFRRWRRLISPFTAVTINCALLSSSCMTLCILSITSCGILAAINCDFAFRFPVAITRTPVYWCVTVYGKLDLNQLLTCVTPMGILVCITSTELWGEVTKPGSAPTLTGPLTTTVNVDNEAAMTNSNTQGSYAQNSQQTFLWRFLALSRTDSKAKPCRLSVEAHTEREARRVLAPHFILSLAARLPLEAHHA